MGVRGGTSPSTVRPIRSYLTEHVESLGIELPAQDLTPFDMECLDVRRTFVEKMFTAHAAYARDRARGKMRHYYDLYRMASQEDVRDFLTTDEYVEVYRDVEEFSRVSWPDAALPGEASFAGSSAFYPDEDGLADLRRHYVMERDLFHVEPPSIEEIIGRMQELIPVMRVP